MDTEKVIGEAEDMIREAYLDPAAVAIRAVEYDYVPVEIKEVLVHLQRYEWHDKQVRQEAGRALHILLAALRQRAGETGALLLPIWTAQMKDAIPGALKEVERAGVAGPCIFPLVQSLQPQGVSFLDRRSNGVERLWSLRSLQDASREVAFPAKVLLVADHLSAAGVRARWSVGVPPTSAPTGKGDPVLVAQLYGPVFLTAVEWA